MSETTGDELAQSSHRAVGMTTDSVQIKIIQGLFVAFFKFKSKTIKYRDFHGNFSASRWKKSRRIRVDILCHVN